MCYPLPGGTHKLLGNQPPKPTEIIRCRSPFNTLVLQDIPSPTNCTVQQNTNSYALQAVMAFSIQVVFVSLPTSPTHWIITDLRFYADLDLDSVDGTDYSCCASSMDHSRSSTPLTHELGVFSYCCAGHVAHRSEWQYLAAGTIGDSIQFYRSTGLGCSYLDSRSTEPNLRRNRSNELTIPADGIRDWTVLPPHNVRREGIFAGVVLRNLQPPHWN